MSGEVALIDYGAGNLFSLENSLKKLGLVVNRVEHVRDWNVRCSRVIVPGVGAFNEGMKELEARGLLDPIRDHAGHGGQVLGICLGAQLLFDSSDEFGETKGLGLIPGRVIALDSKRMQVPNVGWGPVFWRSNDFSSFHGVWMYFVHSFQMKPSNEGAVLGTTGSGDDGFVAAVKSGNVVGVQFHPEKSGQAGLRLLNELLR